MERSLDICLDIRDEPADLRESEASSSELSYFFWTSPQKQSSPADIPLPGIGTDLGHMTEVVVFELPLGSCCFVPHPLVPFDLTSM
ncbi:hypothetical protein [Atopobium sp. oral taxon 416]|uniref:hypothetical protein n=1 Tax=Atopobium sp. oral taxon 416 TaxID=712157 RepID=UPI001BA6D667|nr:hypothetical protein [Atopobium sp. oral taxon 416]QUC03977.1 hypothetical protein J4859_03255 [Atopobium sp. oral taxon 416]